MADDLAAVVGGRIQRIGARVLLVDRAGDEPRLLMVLGHDPHMPTRSFWFTPGGGLEGTESSREGAVRELAEETGYVILPHELVGPVWRRTAIFDFASQPYAQHEEFFVAQLADALNRPQSPSAFTVGEQETIDQISWMSRDDLAADDREVFPARLTGDWREFLEWDGVTLDFGEVDE